MFKIETGRKSFHQWDVNQRLVIADPLITEVHFANTPAGEALVVEVYEEGGKRYANVPNILLQNAWTMRVYGCCEDCVRRRAVFQVVGREKPADYIYTETEVRTYEALADRIKALENQEIPEIPDSPVQSVNGKTGVVELTAEDVGAASSEDVKRLNEEKADYFEVGDGLQMSEDRVLSAVPEAVEEDIRTITTTGEDVIVIDSFETGESFALNAATIDIDATSGGEASVSVKFLQGEAQILEVTASTTSTNCFTGMRMFRENGVWRAQQLGSGSRYRYGTTYENRLIDEASVNQKSKITGFRILNNKKNTGTVITIKGVRANV